MDSGACLPQMLKLEKCRQEYCMIVLRYQISISTKRHLCNFGEKSFVFEAITDVDGPTLVNLKKLEMSAVVLKNDPSMT